MTLAVVYAIDELHFRNSMVSIELTKYYLMNYPILYAVVLSFFSSGANCPEIGGELSRHWGEIVWGELSDISPYLFQQDALIFFNKTR